MANLARVRVGWSGLSIVGPAVSTFYFEEAGSGWTADLKTFFTAIKGGFNIQTLWTIPNQGDLIDVDTGEISGAWVDGAATTEIGASSAQLIAGTGCRVTWKTAGIRNGRRVTGSTFLCPADGSLFDTAGTIDNTKRAAIETAAGNLITASGHVLTVYSKPHPGASDGQAWPAIAAVVPDKVTHLRSRRT